MPTAMLADGRTLRIAVSGHPPEAPKKPLHDVGLPARSRDRRGGVEGGARLGNLRTGEGMPINYDRLELVAKTQADRTANLFDVSNGPVFEIGYTSKLKDDFSTRDAKYHVASLRNGGWVVEHVCSAGAKFGYIDAGFYVGGVAFPDRAAAGQIYVTREEAGLWHLARSTSARPLAAGPPPTSCLRGRRGRGATARGIGGCQGPETLRVLRAAARRDGGAGEAPACRGGGSGSRG